MSIFYCERNEEVGIFLQILNKKTPPTTGRVSSISRMVDLTITS